MKLIFGCGATIEVADPSQATPVGKSIVTFTSPQQDHQRPIPGPDWIEHEKLPKPAEEYRMNCLLMCPVSQRASGRKVDRGWLGKDADKATGRPGYIVTCKVREHVT